MFLSYFFLHLSLHSFSASLRGEVKYFGKVDTRPKVKMEADPACQAQHKKPVSQEDILVTPKHQVANVLVYVKEGLTEKKPQFTGPVVFDQKGCIYVPHVVALQVGQTLKIINSDPTLHNVHSLAKVNSGFNLGMPTQGLVIEKKFEKPEIGMRMKCDVHTWMNAFIHVLKHPYFAVTSETGGFEIPNLPEGDYVLETWHEKLGSKQTKVKMQKTDTLAPLTLE